MHQPIRAHRVRRFAVATLLALAGLLPQFAAAAPSAFCPTLSASVANAGSVQVNVSSCDGPFDGGMSEPLTGFGAAHGTVTIGPNGSGTQFVTYAHNGDTATSDSFQLEDENGDTVTVNVSIGAAAGTIDIAPTTLPTITAGAAFNQALAASGGSAPYTYSIVAGTLPTGLSLSTTGQLAGTATRRGGYSFTVRAQDSTAATGSQAYTGTVANPSISTTPTSGTAYQGVPFSQTVVASGGVAPYTFTLDSGTLPTGMGVSTGGAISGTPTSSPGTYAVSLRVTDSSTGPGVYFELEPYTLTLLPPPTVSIAVSPASVSEDGATVLTYTLTRSVALDSATVVNLAYSGTATSGSDYTGASTTLTIPAGATTATLVLDPAVDGTVEANETAIVTVNPGSGYTPGSPSAATGTILNDDVPTASIAVAPASVAEDGAPNLVYTVSLNQPALSSVSVAYTVSGSATATDYAPVSSPLVIPAGSTSGTIVVNPTADATIEADESVVLTIAAGAGYSVGTPNSASGTILNDDLPNLTINDVALNEGDSGTTSATFTVSLSAPAGPGGVVFDIATADGTASAGTDYVARSLTGVSIPAGSSTYSFTVTINGDALNEPTETFFANVTNVTNAIVVDGQGLGTITNDDPLPALSIDDVLVAEGNTGSTSAVFTVTLAAASAQTVTANYATADGTATAPGDYAATSGTVTFSPGQTSRTLTVAVAGDIAPEANETFVVNLSAPANATLADAQGTGTIQNDDVPVTVSPSTLPDGTVGAGYSQTLNASGGTAPYTYAVSAGALPAGLTLSPTGVLGGTPTAAGTFAFSITATDSSPFPGPFAGTRAYTLQIAAPVLALSPATLPQGTRTVAYSQALSATGGTAPYTYAVTAGALPAGLTLSTTGALSGTPTAIGTFNVTITATDSSTGTGAPFSTSRAYALVIVDQAPVAAASSQTVAYGASATPLTLALSGGAPTSLTLVTAPTHGTAQVTGTTISYTPAAGYAGPDSLTYTATNSGGTSAPATVSITVSAPTITITPSAALSATVGSAYSQTFTFAGGTAPYGGYQVTGLPSGLSVTGTTSTSVTIAGTPTQSGSFGIDVQGTDASTGAGPFTASQTFTLTVAAPTLTMTPASGTLTASYGSAYSQVFTASGGVGPYTYAVTAGALPPGVTLSGNTLTGTPTAPGSYAFTITATDTGSTGAGAPFAIAQNYTLQVAAPTIMLTPATLPAGAVAQAYSQTISASGAAAPYTYALTAGALPPGLTLSATGTLSGTPTAAGTFNATITATDANGQGGSRAYSLQIAAPTLAMTPGSGTLTAAYNSAYSQSFTASGGVGPYTYAATGSLPPGVTLSGNTLSGTPTAPGSYAFTITATDTGSTGAGAPFAIAQNYTLQVGAASITLAPATLANGRVATAYTQAITASGGVAPYTYAVTAGALPNGVTLSSTGTLSGTPTAAGTFNATITATDANGQGGSRAYSLQIAAPTLALVPAAGALTAAYNSPYAQAFTASGGTGPYTYAASGSLPPGVTLSGNTLTGTPTAPGSYAFTITATDTGSTGAGAPFAIAQNYTLQVAAPTITLTPATLPDGSAGVAYSQSLAASGGIAPYTFTISAGALPNGIALASSGALSGTPTQAGTFNATVTATDANGQTGTRAYTLQIAAPVLALSPATLPQGTRTVAYSQALSATGGTAPYTYAVTAGALPAGLTLSTTGTLSGTTTAIGTFNVTITATDSSTGTGAPFSTSRAYALVIVDQAPVAAASSQTVAYGASATPLTLALSGGAPTSLTLVTPPTHGTAQVTGTTISYTPAAGYAGPDSLTYTATNSGGSSAPATVSITVSAPTLSISPATLPGATAGTAYSQAFSTAGGVAPYTYAVASGALPAGLTLSASGTLAGTPTQAGSFAFSVRVTDSTTGTAGTTTTAYTLQVAAPTIAIGPATLAQATSNVAYTQSISATGGAAPYTYAITAGALPPGLALSSAGTLSGTPTAAGSFGFTVTVTDANRFTASRVYTLTVQARPDPSQDREVRGLIDAQAQATRRFADAQIGNFQQRLESLHGAGTRSGFRNGVSLVPSTRCREDARPDADDHCEGPMSPAAAGTDDASPMPPPHGVDGDGAFGFWAGGAIRSGRYDGRAGGGGGLDFETDGLSLGADMRLTPGFALGAGIGYGRDRSDVGESGSRLRGESRAIVGYASLQPGGTVFVDALVGYQELSFDLRRHVTVNGGSVIGERDGGQWFGSVAVGADLGDDGWKVTPYVRLDATRARLDAYTEQGDPVYALAHGEQDVDTRTGNLGLRVAFDREQAWGVLSPMFRLEVQHDFQAEGSASLRYADLPAGTLYSAHLTGFDRTRYLLGLGTGLVLSNGFSVRVEYRGLFGSGERDNGLLLNVQKSY
ncbi:putative Ig domain-containing protein [Lysobacter humi (ex Lee et al. 2017)]